MLNKCALAISLLSSLPTKKRVASRMANTFFISLPSLMANKCAALYLEGPESVSKPDMQHSKPSPQARGEKSQTQTQSLPQCPYILSPEVRDETSSWRQKKRIDPETIQLQGFQIATKNISSLFNVKRWLVHGLMPFLKLNTVHSSLAHCSDCCN